MSVTTHAAWALIHKCEVVISLPEGASISRFQRPHHLETTWHYPDGTTTVWPWVAGAIKLRFDHDSGELRWDGWWFKSSPPPNLPPFPVKLYPLIPAKVLDGGFERDRIYDQYGEVRDPEPIEDYVIYGTLDEARARWATLIAETAPEVRILEGVQNDH